MDKEKAKWFVVILLALIAVFVIWWAFLRPVSVSEVFNRPASSYGEFAEFLKNAPSACIIYDFNGLKDPTRKNVGQCGVDISYSYTYHLNRPVYVYGIENNTCTTINGVSDISTCIRDALGKGCAIFFINGSSGLPPETYKGLIYIPVGDNYTMFDCSVNLNVNTAG